MGNYWASTEKDIPGLLSEKTSPGQTPFTFKIKGVGTIGLMICYDMWFPEVARDLTNLGAEVIIVPTMTTTGDRLHEQIISRSIAITHQCYLISCNGVGVGTRWWISNYRSRRNDFTKEWRRPCHSNSAY